MKKEELLHKYFSNGLNDEETQVFIAFLETDNEFKAQFEFEKNVQHVLKAKRRKVLQQEIQNIATSSKKTTTNTTQHTESWMDPLLFDPKEKKQHTSTIVYWAKWAIAASIVVILATYLYTSNLQKSPEQLYALYFEKYPNTVYPIQKSNAQDNSLTLQAFKAYESDSLDKAIQLFEQLKQETTTHLNFYQGVSYLQNNQAENAIEMLKDMIHQEGKFSGASLWYLSLAYLKNQEPEKALIFLERIIENKSYKHEEAQKIIQNLR